MTANSTPYGPVPRLRAAVARAGHWISRRPYLALLALVVAAGLVIRLWELGSVQVLWFDEITAYYVPFLILHGYGNPATWGLLRTSVPSPLTQAYQLTYSTVTGMVLPGATPTTNAAWVRGPAVACGVALLVLVYGIGTELFDRRVGLVAATLGAVVPWTVYWSRFAGVIAPLELWPAAAIYVALVAVRRRDPRLMLLSLVFGAFTVYTHEAGIVALLLLILPFWWVCARAMTKTSGGPLSWRSLRSTVQFSLPFLGALLLMLVPLVAFEFQPVTAGTSLAGSGQLVWQHCGSISCTASTFLSNAALSWSPNFLAFTGGLAGAQSAGFETHISIGGVWQSGGGFTGMLTVLGLLVYPAIVLLAARFPRRLTRGNANASWLAIFLVLSYTAVGGVVYYDNPNAARLGFAVGLLLVFMGWLIVELIDLAVGAVHRLGRVRRSGNHTMDAGRPRRTSWKPDPVPDLSARTRAIAVGVGAAVLIAPVGGAYLYDYFVEFPPIASTYFYGQIEQVGAMLSSDGLWSQPLVVQCPSDLVYILPAELAFYDPLKPPAAALYVFNGSVASNTGPLSSQPNGLIFVSMVNATVDELHSAGVPATALTSENGVSLFWIPGRSSTHATLDAVAAWVNAPGQNFSAESLAWNVTQAPTNGSIESSPVSGGYAVLTQLPSNRSNTTWEMWGQFAERLNLPTYNLLSVNWSFVSTNKSDRLTLAPLYWNGTAVVLGTARLVYPATLLNVAPVANLSFELAGIAVSANLSSGASQTLLLSNVSAHGLTPQSSVTCDRPQSVLLGSPDDIAVPAGNGLNFTAVNSTLVTVLCMPANPPGNGHTYYAQLTFQVLTNLSTPLTMAAGAPGFVTTVVTGIYGPVGTSITVYAGIQGSPPATPVDVRVAVAFVGGILLEDLALVSFTGSPPVV